MKENLSVQVAGGIFPPTYATSGSLGADLYVSGSMTVAVGNFAMIPTDLSIQYPEGYAAFVMLRSSTPMKYGLIIPHGVGLIDHDYCGPNDTISIPVYNIGNSSAFLKKGDRIAQLVFVKVDQLPFIIGSETENNPNRGGFGSTGQ